MNNDIVYNQEVETNTNKKRIIFDITWIYVFHNLATNKNKKKNINDIIPEEVLLFIVQMLKKGSTNQWGPGRTWSTNRILI